MRSLSVPLASILAVAGMAGPLTPHQDHPGPAGGTNPPFCQVRTPELKGLTPALLATALPDGAEVFGGSYARSGDLVTVLHAVLPDCQPVAGFGAHGTATVSMAVRSAPAEVTVIQAMPDGKLLLGGGAGSDLVVGRLLQNGRLDPSFGISGWARLPSPIKPPKGFVSRPAIGSMALGPAGMVYLAGNDGTAHCCVEDFVGALSASGRPESSFGDHGWAALPTLAGSYETALFSVPGGILVMGFVMYTGCGGPVLARVGPNGQLDQAFAAATHAVLAKAAPGYALSPALYLRSGGAFALAGELMPSGCLVRPPKAADHGLALGFLPSGHIDPSFGTAGKTELPPAAFGQTWAAPGQDGSAFVVTEQVPGLAPYGQPRALNILRLSAAGRLERTSGLSGTTAINLSWASSPNSYPEVVVLASPGMRPVVVVAAKQQARISTLPTAAN